MTYNMDFLFVAMILLVLVLWHYYSQRRPDNLNTRVSYFCGAGQSGCAGRNSEYLLYHFHKGKLRNRSCSYDDGILCVPGADSLCIYLLYLYAQGKSYGFVEVSGPVRRSDADTSGDYPDQSLYRSVIFL